MNAQQLIDELKEQNITLYRQGYRLKWQAPIDFIPTDEMNKVIKSHWEEILRSVDGPVPRWILKGKGACNLGEGDCLKYLSLLPANLVDLIVTDPPYGYEYMGKEWDKAVPSVDIWKECLRVLKPGGFAFIMSAPRQDVLARMIVNLEDAGFCTNSSSIYWTYASGFPKAQNLSKAIQKRIRAGQLDLSTEEINEFDGVYAGFQPKPAVEIILVVRKPLSEKTYVDQALSNRKGITRLDDCRIPDQEGKSYFPPNLLVSDDVLDGDRNHAGSYSRRFSLDAWYQQKHAEGLNIDALNESDEKVFPFLVVPKAGKREKDFGLENFDPVVTNDGRKKSIDNPFQRGKTKRFNPHPTVKPILLMSYLITLGSDEGDLVFDPFCGSGTTCMAARLLKRISIGIEKDPEYFKVASARIKALTTTTWFDKSETDSDLEKSPNIKKATIKASNSIRKSKKDVIFHEKPGIALTPQKKIDAHNFPFSLNTVIGCHFGCQYCYLQGYPFNRHAKFPIEAKIKLWIPERLDKDLGKYASLPQHLKRVQVNVATEGYLPLVISRVKRELNRDIMAEVLGVFRKHWENGNHWMVHLITKSHMVLKHLDLIKAMNDQVQLEMTITTLDENRRRQIEGSAPSVQKRLKVMKAFAEAGVFVRAMCMPLIGTREDAEAIRSVCFQIGARAFKHKGVNYWDEASLLDGQTKRNSGRHDEVYEDLLVMSSEPYRENGEIKRMTVKMPAIVKSGKTKRWKGYKDSDLQDREMAIEMSGYSEINDINWGYVR